MIRVVTKGEYMLLKTCDDRTLLLLEENDPVMWIADSGCADLLEICDKAYSTKCVIVYGNYRLYEVKDESYLTGWEHLELTVGKGRWQGYLLPHGLPSGGKRRREIISTEELISVVRIA